MSKIEHVLRIADGVEMTESLLADYISKHDRMIEAKYKPLLDAYTTNYAILDKSINTKSDFKPDNRIAVNFAKYLVDTMNGFFIGIPIKVSSDDESINNELQFLDKYNDQDDNNAELSKLCSIFGHAFEMYFNDEEGEIGITYLSPMDAFMIYDESILERPRYFIRVYTDTNNVRRGSISDSEYVRYFRFDPSVKWDLDETGAIYQEEHHFDGVPAVEYLENAERQGLFEPVMSMIDSYNKAISEKANDVDYFADAYLKILGARMEQEDLNQIRRNRIINFDGSSDGNLVVEFLQKPSADGTQENLLNRLERLIFQISMIANINDENFGTSSGIALKYKLQSMSNLAMTKERKFTSGMNQRYKLIFSNPAAHLSSDDWVKINYKFMRNFPANLTDEVTNAKNLSGVVSKETQLSVLSIVDDAQAEIDRMEKEQDPIGYQTDYPTQRVNNDDGTQ